MEVVGMSEEELRRFRREREVKRKIDAIKRNTSNLAEDPVSVEPDEVDLVRPAVETTNPAWRMDRSMAFTTDHGRVLSWMAGAARHPRGRARNGDPIQSNDELDWLFLRPPPTVVSVRQDLLERAAQRSRSMNRRVQAAQVRSVNLSGSTASSPFALSSQREEITLPRRKRRARQLVSVPYQIPQTKLRASQKGPAEKWDSRPARSSIPVLGTAGQSISTEGSSAPLRTKGFSIFKKVKR
jgi:hypothetical protein